MQAYNIYVSHKEAELKQLIDKITERTCDKQANEKKMQRLMNSQQHFKEQFIRAEKNNADLKSQIQGLKEDLDSEREQKEFYHKSALESKR